MLKKRFFTTLRSVQNDKMVNLQHPAQAGLNLFFTFRFCNSLFLNKIYRKCYLDLGKLLVLRITLPY
ncbi:MAG: hypothetical protein KJ666_12860 [Bacteroidetes bacterium]|nr:hypothetical protein [Bacteroidota bacterium]